jgi:hypothetical protein
MLMPWTPTISTITVSVGPQDAGSAFDDVGVAAKCLGHGTTTSSSATASTRPAGSGLASSIDQITDSALASLTVAGCVTLAEPVPVALLPHRMLSYARVTAAMLAALIGPLLPGRGVARLLAMALGRRGRAVPERRGPTVQAVGIGAVAQRMIVERRHKGDTLGIGAAIAAGELRRVDEPLGHLGQREAAAFDRSRPRRPEPARRPPDKAG